MMKKYVLKIGPNSTFRGPTPLHNSMPAMDYFLNITHIRCGHYRRTWMSCIALRLLKHGKSMNVVDEQPTLNVVTCNQDNQYDHVTWYE